MKNLTKLIVITLILIMSNNSIAQITPGNPIEGYRVYPGKLDFGSCKVNQFTIGYRLNSNGTQVEVYSNVKWEGDSKNNTCLSNENFQIFLSIGTDSVPKYIYAGGTDILKVGIGNNQWSTNPFSASIGWDKLITKNFGLKEDLHFYTDEEAKAIWNNGLVIKSIKMVTSNRKVYVFK